MPSASRAADGAHIPRRCTPSATTARVSARLRSLNSGAMIFVSVHERSPVAARVGVPSVPLYVLLRSIVPGRRGRPVSQRAHGPRLASGGDMLGLGMVLIVRPARLVW